MTLDATGDAGCQALACKVPALVRHAGKGDFQSVLGPSAVMYDPWIACSRPANWKAEIVSFPFNIHLTSVNDCEQLKVEELLKRGQDTEWSRCIGIFGMHWTHLHPVTQCIPVLNIGLHPSFHDVTPQDPNVEDDFGLTALHCAAKKGDRKATHKKTLLRHIVSTWHKETILKLLASRKVAIANSPRVCIMYI